MNKALIAPVAILVVFALKQYLNVEITEGAVEQALNTLVIVGAGIWAAVTHPKQKAA